MYLLLGSLLAATVAGLITRLYRAHALRAQLLDVPNERSSHAVPTPRGGGVAIVVVVCAAFVCVGALEETWRSIAAFTMLAALGVAAVGYLDDLRGVAASKRFAVHVLGAVVLLMATRELGPLDLPAVPPVPVVQWLLTLVSILWLLNLFNFMDGIDGIAAMEAAFASLGIALCAYFGPGISDALLALCLAVAASSMGFLIYNWPPARIFMGDVGSGFLGFILGSLAVIAHRESGVDPWVIAILLGVFVTDSTVTLLRRVARGKRWHEAHRSHAYQRLSRELGSHRSVTLGALAINLIWLLPLSILATHRPGNSMVVALVAYAPLLAIAIWAGAGSDEPAPVRR
jgi:Fuc2NAc and GlcNAc transferase